MTTIQRPKDAGKLGDYKRHEIDQTFVRRFDNAISRLVELRLGDRDVLWQFKAALRHPGAPQDANMPRYRLYRGNYRSWKEYNPAVLYALIQGIIYDWWVYKNGRMGQCVTPQRERCRRRAIAGMLRLWAVIKNGARTVGSVDKAYRVRPIVK